MNFDETPEFLKEVKQLQKKWRSLPGDLQDAQKLIANLYIGQGGDDKLLEYRAAFFNGRRAAVLLETDDGREVVKMRLDVASLGTRDAVRLIFIYIKNPQGITFIELYAKNEKGREDVRRIRKYL